MPAAPTPPTAADTRAATAAGPATDDLSRALATALGVADVERVERLTGGASRETWRFDAVHADGHVEHLVLRRDPPRRPGPPGAMAREAAAMRAASAAGLAVPEVLLATDDQALWGAAGIVMRLVEGEAVARRILRDDTYAAARGMLTAQCGTFLGGLHRLDPDQVPDLPPAGDPLDGLRHQLETAGQPSPTFELAVRWLDAHRPPPTGDAVVHGDFRLGNLMVGPEGLRAVLDWELVHRGDPLEDLGWLCVRAWRYGAAPPVAGVGTRDELLAAYGAARGCRVDPEHLRWWEVLNTLKWGVICMAQAEAHLSGLVRSVELAAIGRRVAEQEWDLLQLLSADPGAPVPPDLPVPGDPAAGHPPAAAYGRPTAGELLDAVEEFLRDEVVPATTGQVSFHARVAAKVVAIVARELAAGPPPEVDDGLVDEIRSGAWDHDLAGLAATLGPVVAARLAVSNPAYARPHR